jgi:tripartite ATP-independent transporter DctM subunit
VSAFGLALLGLVALGLVLTGLPAYLVLIGAALAGALVGWAGGAIPAELLGALPSRLLNLLESDLLQALPLYVLMGVLLDRLPVASALFRSGVALMRSSASAPLVSGMALGAVLGPMNGSVGASVMALSRAVAPKLLAAGVPAARRHAVIAVASTFGVVVPPSLVLILLGDAMLSAHTVAVNVTGRSERVINTQDLFHGALLPAALVLILCLAIAWWSGRKTPKADGEGGQPLRVGEAALAAISLSLLVALLAGVTTGRFYAVEAAAMGAFTLCVAGVAGGHLRGSALRTMLREVMATTGALFALLVGATTFTLVLRTLGSDRLVAEMIAALPLGATGTVAVVLAAIGLVAFVLDAFEIIFVIVPIVVPPLLVRVPDASWVAVLVLLTLQASFLLPPFGYALMMSRGALKESVPTGALARALAPYLAAQLLVLAAVLLVPALVHVGEAPGSRSRSADAPLSDEEARRRLEEMLAPPPAAD